MNGALFFIEMEKDGGMSAFPTNNAVAERDTATGSAPTGNISLAGKRTLTAISLTENVAWKWMFGRPTSESMPGAKEKRLAFFIWDFPCCSIMVNK